MTKQRGNPNKGENKMEQKKGLTEIIEQKMNAERIDNELKEVRKEQRGNSTKKHGKPKFEIRVSPERRETWQRAADIEKRSLSDFVRIATDEKTERITQMQKISFRTQTAEAEIIHKIVDRAMEMARKLTGRSPDFKPIDLTMDITATHCNGTPLRLSELLAAPDFDFSHDVFGIMRHINRTTGKLEDHFLPRFAAKTD